MEVMSIMKRTLILAGCVAALGLGTVTLIAGGGRGGGGGAGGGGFGGGGGAGGGGFGGRGGGVNQLDTYRQAMEVTDDTEWGVISAKITAVTTARTAATPAFGGRGGGGRGRGGMGGGAVGGAATTTPAVPAEADAVAALQKAYDDKVSTADMKAAIAKVIADHKQKEADYLKAQDDLRGLLTARQEAYLTLQGVLR